MNTEIENPETETPGAKGGLDPRGLEGGLQVATETALQRARNVA